jgi:adenine phosphoribosyltransferase
MHDSNVSVDELRAAIRNVPDFPKPGIQFKDITPVLGYGRLFGGSIDLLLGSHRPGAIDAVAGIDARGFIFAAAAALRLGCAFVPIRKKDKLPYRTFEQSYDLEYGSNTIAIHTDAVRPGARVLLIDDLLATGGTAGAASSLLQRAGVRIVEVSFLIELGFLEGRRKLQGHPVRSLIVY